MFRIFLVLWNLARLSAALLSRRLSNFKAIPWFRLPICRLRDFDIRRLDIETGQLLSAVYPIKDANGVVNLYFVMVITISYCIHMSYFTVLVALCIFLKCYVEIYWRLQLFSISSCLSCCRTTHWKHITKPYPTLHHVHVYCIRQGLYLPSGKTYRQI